MKERKNKQTNNFESLWDDETLSRFEPHFQTVEKKLQKTQHSAQVTGEVVDLFLTKIFQVMVRMLGAKPTETPTTASKQRQIREATPLSRGQKRGANFQEEDL